MTFNKVDLVYTDYRWTEYDTDDPKISGDIDSATFCRQEGFEILYFINACATKWHWLVFKKKLCQKLEKALRQRIPPYLKTQVEVKEWFEEYHHSFWSKM
ncbi:MAG: hypothetical protein ABIX01_22720 [Chitinophagaceae bacterium]